MTTEKGATRRNATSAAPNPVMQLKRHGMELFRPTGLQELALVLQRDLAAWPPRLPEQPIFYPVLNLAYATQIARDWNTKSPEQVGYVTRFEVDDTYASRFPRKIVGGRQHEELWVPAEELDAFNSHISPPIQVVAAFFGSDFQGVIPTCGALRGRNARDQLRVFAELYIRSSGDPRDEVIMNRDAVFLHFPFWQSLDPSTVELGVPRNDVLAAIRRVWTEAFPGVPILAEDEPT
jgi:hypothetical protein